MNANVAQNYLRTKVLTATPEQLQEYLRRLNPEDLGRFNP